MSSPLQNKSTWMWPMATIYMMTWINENLKGDIQFLYFFFFHASVMYLADFSWMFNCAFRRTNVSLSTIDVLLGWEVMQEMLGSGSAKGIIGGLQALVIPPPMPMHVCQRVHTTRSRVYGTYNKKEAHKKLEIYTLHLLTEFHDGTQWQPAAPYAHTQARFQQMWIICRLTRFAGLIPMPLYLKGSCPFTVYIWLTAVALSYSWKDMIYIL